MMRGYTQALALTSAAQTDLDMKFAEVSQALDAIGKLIETLPAALASEWAAKDDEVSASMTKLVVALQDAQTAVRDAPRIVTATTPAT